MSVKIRLTRMGRKKVPFYRIVAIDSHKRRDGKYLEKIGTYNPLTQPEQVNIDRDLALKWLKNGAIPSDTVRSMFSREGIMFEMDLRKRGLSEEQIAEEMKKWEALQRERIKKREAMEAQAKREKEKTEPEEKKAAPQAEEQEAEPEEKKTVPQTEEQEAEPEEKKTAPQTEEQEAEPEQTAKAEQEPEGSAEETEEKPDQPEEPAEEEKTGE